MSNFITSLTNKGIDVVSGKINSFIPKGIPAEVLPNIGISDKTSKKTQTIAQNDDFRVRIRPKPGREQSIYGPRDKTNIMLPLYNTGGLLFPYTPVISANFSVDYSSISPIHSIMDYLSYQRTPSPEFSITGQFSAQNTREAEYCLSVIHFLRTVTKMYFGQESYKGTNIPIGLAPPVLLLNGYGTYMLNNLPIIIKSYSIELNNNVDYVKINLQSPNLSANSSGSNKQNNSPMQLSDAEKRLRENTASFMLNKSKFLPPASAEDITTANKLLSEAQSGSRSGTVTGMTGTAYVPTLFTISISVVVQHSPKQVREFNLESFRRGELLYERRYSGKSNKIGGYW